MPTISEVVSYQPRLRSRGTQRGSEDARASQYGKELYFSNLLVNLPLHNQVNVQTVREFTFSKGTQSHKQCSILIVGETGGMVQKGEAENSDFVT